MRDSKQIIKLEKLKQYRNKHDDRYKAKIERVAADIESGVTDKLTLDIGRQRYQ